MGMSSLKGPKLRWCAFRIKYNVLHIQCHELGDCSNDMTEGLLFLVALWYIKAWDAQCTQRHPANVYKIAAPRQLRISMPCDGECNSGEL